MIRVILPAHLRTLGRAGSEITLEVKANTIGGVLDALEVCYPMLQGAVRDHVTLQRRPFVRYFACEQDLSHERLDFPLPSRVVSGAEPFLIVAAIAGGSI
jgi:sulfur-carrier protein